MRQGYLTLLIGVLFCLTVVHSQQSFAERKSDCRISFGAVLPLSGEGADWGRNTQQGIDLAIAEENAAGGVRGCMLKMIYEDSPSARPDSALRAYRKLVSSDGVKFVLGFLNQDEAQAVGPLFTRDGVLVVSTYTTGKVSENMTSVVMDPLAEAVQLADYVFARHKSVAILASDSAWDHTFAVAFSQHFEKLGGKVLVTEEPSFSTTEVQPYVLRAVKSKPQAIVLPTYYLFAAYQRELSRLQYSGVRYSAEVDQGLIDTSAGAAEGTIYLGYAQPSPDFSKAYQLKYQVMPDIPAANFYDGVKLLVKSLRESDGSVAGAKSYLCLLYTSPSPRD